MPTERLTPDQGPGNRSVEIEVSHIEALPRKFQIGRAAGIDSARQGVVRGVGGGQRLVKRVCFDHGQHRPKYFLLGNSIRGFDVDKHGRPDEPAGMHHGAFHQNPRFLVSDFDVVQDLGVRPLIDHGSDLCTRHLRIAHPQTQDRLFQPLEKEVVHRGMHDDTRTG